MKISEHTKLPWTVSQYSVHIFSQGADGANICSCGAPRASGFIGYTPVNFDNPQLNEAVANAAFIVRACNSHDALVAALERLIEYAEASDGSGYGTLATDLVSKIASEALAHRQVQNVTHHRSMRD